MIEAIIIQFLNENGFIASAEEPIKALDEYIVVEKTGSSELDYIKNAIIAIYFLVFCSIYFLPFLI